MERCCFSFPAIAAATGDVKVTFAFLTSRAINCCCSTSLPGNVDDAVVRQEGKTGDNTRNALLRFLDYEAGCSHVFRLSFSLNARMGTVLELLSTIAPVRGLDIVCFAVPPLSTDQRSFPVVTKVLDSSDVIPDVIFCQSHTWQRDYRSFTVSWFVVNILVCGNDGSVTVGHMPCVVPLVSGHLAREDIFASIVSLLHMSIECERYLRNCALHCCHTYGARVVISDTFHDGASVSQAAVLYGTVDVGDVVLVSSQGGDSVGRAKSLVFQAVVVKRGMENGITLYDVKEVDTAVVIKELACTRLVPL